MVEACAQSNVRTLRVCFIGKTPDLKLCEFCAFVERWNCSEAGTIHQESHGGGIKRVSLIIIFMTIHRLPRSN